jgi:hypothetical protein
MVGDDVAATAAVSEVGYCQKMSKRIEATRMFLSVLIVGLVASIAGWLMGGLTVKQQAISGGGDESVDSVSRLLPPEWKGTA